MASNRLREAADAMIEENTRLATELKNLKRDMDAMRCYNESLEQKLKEHEHDPADNSVKTAKNAISVLLEGDTFLFRSSLLEQGYVGGQKAASMLEEQVKICAEERQLEKHCTISVQIFISNLTQALSAPSTTHALFIAGFSQHPFFDVIYCGNSKETARTKLQNALRYNAASEGVKMVLFGGREDSAHLGVLTSVKAAYGDKLVLIAHDNMPQAIRALGYPIKFRFEEIFTTSERLATRSPSLTPGHAPNQLEAPKHLTVLAQRNFRTVPCWPFHLQNHCYKGNKCTYSHDPVTEEAKDGLRIRYAADMAAKKQTEYTEYDTSVSVFMPLLMALKRNKDVRGALRAALGDSPAVKSFLAQSNFSSFRDYATAAERNGLVLLCPGETAGGERIKAGARVADLLGPNGPDGKALVSALEGRLNASPSAGDHSSASASGFSELGSDSLVAPEVGSCSISSGLGWD